MSEFALTPHAARQLVMTSKEKLEYVFPPVNPKEMTPEQREEWNRFYRNYKQRQMRKSRKLERERQAVIEAEKEATELENRKQAFLQYNSVPDLLWDLKQQCDRIEQQIRDLETYGTTEPYR